jgi:hypothetical protein
MECDFVLGRRKTRSPLKISGLQFLRVEMEGVALGFAAFTKRSD